MSKASPRKAAINAVAISSSDHLFILAAVSNCFLYVPHDVLPSLRTKRLHNIHAPITHKSTFFACFFDIVPQDRDLRKKKCLVKNKKDVSAKPKETYEELFEKKLSVALEWHSGGCFTGKGILMLANPRLLQQIDVAIAIFRTKIPSSPLDCFLLIAIKCYLNGTSLICDIIGSIFVFAQSLFAV
ncbi:hypothetical protein NQ318_019518 [Aromia moschata]|uniref:Uncharacterized protein n=1 Tax=Aromia moschata TaxID=1265417 RepID=A0AAV8XXS1_9CUCU|nr:hypothetical protein NQ318_019518 [Aromia moschata]